MRQAVNLIWLVLVLGVLALLGQSLGLFDVPVLHGFRFPLPLAETPLATVVATPGPPPPTLAAVVRAATPAPVPTSGACTTAARRFVQGMAALKAALGASMGDAVECERVVDEAGDTEQRTSTGLAYYRASSNTAAFTNGFDHWAIGSTGIVHWTGDDLEPPPQPEPPQSDQE